MESKKIIYSSIDEYIATFPENVQETLKELRVRFPMDKPLPLKLISEIVKLRVEQNTNKIIT